MNARNASNLRKHQRKDTGRRNQTKRRADKASESKNQDFVEDARKISELYGKYAAVNDPDGFASAVLEYANAHLRLSGRISRFQEIIAGHQPQDLEDSIFVLPQTRPSESLESPVALGDAYAREQQRLESLNREFQKLLREIS